MPEAEEAGRLLARADGESKPAASCCSCWCTLKWLLCLLLLLGAAAAAVVICVLV